MGSSVSRSQNENPCLKQIGFGVTAAGAVMIGAGVLTLPHIGLILVPVGTIIFTGGVGVLLYTWFRSSSDVPKSTPSWISSQGRGLVEPAGLRPFLDLHLQEMLPKECMNKAVLDKLEKEILESRSKSAGMSSTFDVELPGTGFVTGVFHVTYQHNDDKWDIRTAYITNSLAGGKHCHRDASAAKSAKLRLMQTLGMPSEA